MATTKASAKTAAKKTVAPVKAAVKTANKAVVKKAVQAPVKTAVNKPAPAARPAKPVAAKAAPAKAIAPKKPAAKPAAKVQQKEAQPANYTRKVKEPTQVNGVAATKSGIKVTVTKKPTPSAEAVRHAAEINHMLDSVVAVPQRVTEGSSNNASLAQGIGTTSEITRKQALQRSQL